MDKVQVVKLERIVLESRRKCEFCGGHGNRYELFDGEYHECNSCTNGMREHWGKNYPFHAENVREFAQFARDSGGFEIG